jgi:hypothetical protein
LIDLLGLAWISSICETLLSIKIYLINRSFFKILYDFKIKIILLKIILSPSSTFQAPDSSPKLHPVNSLFAPSTTVLLPFPPLLDFSNASPNFSYAFYNSHNFVAATPVAAEPPSHTVVLAVPTLGFPGVQSSIYRP